MQRGGRRLNADLRPRELPHPQLMNVLVAVKRVPITGGRIVLREDEQAIDTKHLGFTISPHEECAAEEAVRLIEAHGGASTVLTLGPPEAEEQLRDMLALGIDDAIHLGPFRLAVLCGNWAMTYGTRGVADVFP